MCHILNVCVCVFSRQQISPQFIWEWSSAAGSHWGRFRSDGMPCSMTLSYPSKCSEKCLPKWTSLFHVTVSRHFFFCCSIGREFELQSVCNILRLLISTMLIVSLIICVFDVYDVCRLAWQAMRQLHPEAIAAIQSKALFSQAEEALLAKITSVSQQIFPLRTCSLGPSNKQFIRHQNRN